MRFRLPSLKGCERCALGLAVVLGPLAALGQAPWGLWPLTLLALAGVMALVAGAPSAGRAFLRAWAAGGAQFGIALGWLIEPFLVDAAATGWMAPFAVALMAFGLALFWGGAAALAVAAARGSVARLWLFALMMLGFEALRGWVFTGFPWAMLGHVWIGTPVDQIAALGGALSLSALALALSAGLVTAGLRLAEGRAARAALAPVLALAALAAAWVWGGARLAEPPPEPPGITLRLVQANVPQDLKWRPDLVEGFFFRHLDLSAGPPVDLVIWPETAAPFFLDRPGDGLAMAAEAAAAPVVMGLQRRHVGVDGVRRYFNSLAVLDRAGTVQAVYDKHHLVPFGEYIPLIGPWAEARGWSGLAAQVLTGYTPGPGPALLDLGPAGMALPLICYEAVFPRNLRTLARPDWVLQITNDAWFGSASGPWQHLAQARLRAVETGLPLVRAANTGVSAVIDARGRITASLGLNETGGLDAPLPGARPATPYARLGDTPWHVLLVLAGLGALLAAWRRRNRVDAGPQAR